jgi:hypothetical protein
VAEVDAGNRKAVGKAISEVSGTLADKVIRYVIGSATETRILSHLIWVGCIPQPKPDFRL